MNSSGQDEEADKEQALYYNYKCSMRCTRGINGVGVKKKKMRNS